VQTRLEAAGIEPAPGEGKRIVGHVLGWNNLEVLLHEHDLISLSKMNTIDGYVTRRSDGEPLAYVLGKADFWGREWVVGPGILVPRPDTEILVREALARLPEGAAKVAEMGVGSGCVIGSLLIERPELEAYGTDISDVVIAVARQNVPVGCRFTVGDGLASVQNGLDMVVSNPPYIADAEYAKLESGVRDFEPKLALVGAGENADGLVYYRYLAKAALDKVKAGGWLVVEIGYTQAKAVTDLMKAQGWVEVACVPDLAGRDRVVVARKAV
jgi:release factor glutamine methyltransferase